MRTEVLQKIAELDKTDIEKFGKELEEILAQESITYRDHNKLSKREKEIMTLVPDGYSNQEIADKIGISRRTVEIHRANIIKKLHLKSQTAQLKEYIKVNGI